MKRLKLHKAMIKKSIIHGLQLQKRSINGKRKQNNTRSAPAKPEETNCHNTTTTCHLTAAKTAKERLTAKIQRSSPLSDTQYTEVYEDMRPMTYAICRHTQYADHQDKWLSDSLPVQKRQTSLFIPVSTSACRSKLALNLSHLLFLFVLQMV